ncbi:hypothetical protein LZ30DRAFT_701105 [Colletotrichum cereale]|nr:hypothetical protein LZ30DRAFT_701105 [Colletotrichum cereale]
MLLPGEARIASPAAVLCILAPRCRGLRSVPSPWAERLVRYLGRYSIPVALGFCMSTYQKMNIPRNEIVSEATGIK